MGWPPVPRGCRASEHPSPSAAKATVSRRASRALATFIPSDFGLLLHARALQETLWGRGGADLANKPVRTIRGGSCGCKSCSDFLPYSYCSRCPRGLKTRPRKKRRKSRRSSRRHRRKRQSRKKRLKRRSRSRSRRNTSWKAATRTGHFILPTRRVSE